MPRYSTAWNLDTNQKRSKTWRSAVTAQLKMARYSSVRLKRAAFGTIRFRFFATAIQPFQQCIWLEQ
jgi:hypothetical protein